MLLIWCLIRGIDNFIIAQIPFDIKAQPIVFVKNFTTRDYNAHNQNFCITQDHRGVIYVGNGMGLLEYDGKNWSIVEKTKNKYIYSLATSENGRVFVGGDSELGYLSVNTKGKVYFVSLLPLLPKEQHQFGPVYRTIALGSNVYFQAANYIFCYRGNKFYTVYKSESGSIGYIYLVDQEVWGSDDKGIFKINFVHSNYSITRIPGTESINGLLLPQILKLSPDTYLLANDTKLLKLKNGSIASFQNEASSYIEQHRVQDALYLVDSTIAIATFTGGVIRIDRDGKVLNLFKKENNLVEDQITKLFLDRERVLWVATNNGIARVEIPSPLLIFTEIHKVRGVVTAITNFNGYLYVSTSQGIYSKVYSIYNYNLFTELRSQYFHFIKPFRNIIVVGSTNGLFNITGFIINSIDLPKSQCFFAYSLPHSNNNNKCRELLAVGTNNQILLLDLDDKTSELRAINTIALKGDIRSITSDARGRIWFGTHSHGVGCIEFEGNNYAAGQPYKVRYFGLESGLPEMEENVVAFLYGKLVVGTHQGLHSFNEKTQKFEPEKMFGTYFTQRNCHIFAMDYNRNNGITCLLNVRETPNGAKEEIFIIEPNKKNPNQFIINKNPFLRAGHLSVNTVKVDDSGLIWAGCSDG
ncbi:MAG: hypothetical protein RML72_01435, partial [Bacteroidia bacterium]|nr:hypothetical protein [Bacteroidia bacterium]MDW8157521.1 hypothetical protein [Bacteroidia bacterium]